FKSIAKILGTGYQPLMRQILTRFVESEKKRMWNHVVSEAYKLVEEQNKQDNDNDDSNKKAA
ncbi:MAG: hypothetical protein ACRESK_03685, partial [Gammaproteobacteria bacterium]